MPLLKQDFIKEDPWRIFRIMSEFVDGFEELADVKKAVAIFGSAQKKKATKIIKTAEASASTWAFCGISHFFPEAV